MTYTHFRKIIRDDNGLIDPQSGMTELAPRGVPGWPGMVQGYRVVSVEPGAIAGWGGGPSNRGRASSHGRRRPG